LKVRFVCLVIIAAVLLFTLPGCWEAFIEEPLELYFESKVLFSVLLPGRSNDFFEVRAGFRNADFALLKFEGDSFEGYEDTDLFILRGTDPPFSPIDDGIFAEDYTLYDYIFLPDDSRMARTDFGYDQNLDEATIDFSILELVETEKGLTFQINALERFQASKFPNITEFRGTATAGDSLDNGRVYSSFITSDVVYEVNILVSDGVISDPKESFSAFLSVADLRAELSSILEESSVPSGGQIELLRFIKIDPETSVYILSVQTDTGHISVVARYDGTEMNVIPYKDVVLPEEDFYGQFERIEKLVDFIPAGYIIYEYLFIGEYSGYFFDIYDVENDSHHFTDDLFLTRYAGWKYENGNLHLLGLLSVNNPPKISLISIPLENLLSGISPVPQTE
jgi:hypothetical protein